MNNKYLIMSKSLQKYDKLAIKAPDQIRQKGGQPQIFVFVNQTLLVILHLAKIRFIQNLI